VRILVAANVWLDEAIGNLTNQTLQKLSEPNLLFVFIFHFQSQIKDLAVADYTT
jgi:hypothetical protein